MQENYADMEPAETDESVLLCTAGYDRVIRFWEAPTALCTREVQMPECQANCLVISPDKTLLAAGGNPSAKVWSIAKPAKDPIMSLEGHTNNIISMGFQKNHKWMFTASEDGTLKIWDRRTAACQRDKTLHENKKIMISCAVLHPNQGEIIAGDQSGTISIWDLAENKIRAKFQPEGKAIPIRSLSIANDASVLVAATHKGVVYEYRPTDRKDNSKAYSAKLSAMKPDGDGDGDESKSDERNSARPNLLNSGSNGAEQRKAESSSGFELTHKFAAHDTYCLKCVLSSDTRFLATTSSDTTIKIWNVEKEYELYTTLRGHQKWVWDCAFSADSAYLVSASSDRTAKLWDLKAGQYIVDYVDHSKAVTCVALNDSS